MKRTTHPILLVLIALVAVGCSCQKGTIFRPMEDLRIYAGVKIGDQRLFASENDTVTLRITDIDEEASDCLGSSLYTVHGLVSGFPNGKWMVLTVSYTFTDGANNGRKGKDYHIFQVTTDVQFFAGYVEEDGRNVPYNYEKIVDYGARIDGQYILPHKISLLSDYYFSNSSQAVLGIHLERVGIVMFHDPSGRRWDYVRDIK